MSKKRIVILGVTGSIGESTLKVIQGHQDKFELVGCAAYSNIEKLKRIVDHFGVKNVCIYNETMHTEGKSLIGNDLMTGIEGLNALASMDGVDIVVMAIPGVLGLEPALKAIEARKDLAVASKEILVMAGGVVMDAAREAGVSILPLDSEHSAIFQCLRGNKIEMVSKVILTASGGPFWGRTKEEMANVTLKEALKHPNWSMGPKVTLDSATMANKGLELMEAKWLFGLQHDQLEVLVHPQSIVHSIVKYLDGNHIAQLSPPCMTYAIQYALEYPERSPGVADVLDFSKGLTLTFENADYERFPCLKLAIESMQAGGVAPTTYNAANEVAGQAFIDGKIAFLQIADVIDKVLSQMSNKHLSNLEMIMETHKESVRIAKEVVNGI